MSQKILISILSLALLASLAGCGKDDPAPAASAPVAKAADKAQIPASPAADESVTKANDDTLPVDWFEANVRISCQVRRGERILAETPAIGREDSGTAIASVVDLPLRGEFYAFTARFVTNDSFQLLISHRSDRNGPHGVIWSKKYAVTRSVHFVQKLKKLKLEIECFRQTGSPLVTR